MSKLNVKRVQTELTPVEYDKLIRVAKQEGFTVKEVARQALEEWVAAKIKFDFLDPLFDFSRTIKTKKTDASKVDKVVYSRRAID